jgi:antirestriction protein ArdC
MKTRQDIYARVTESVITSLEQGVRPWLKPWNAEHSAGRITRPLRANGVPYQGVNVLLLWGEAMDKGYTAPIWMTFNQARELNGRVRKGEHGSTVVYADRITKIEAGENGEDVERAVPFLRSYTVFNVEQIEELPAHYYAEPSEPLPVGERIGQANCFIDGTGATIRHGGNQAFYSLTDDRVQLPPFESFKDPQSYYATALHELTHWTRHPSRLAREFGRKRFGDAGYATEELVAELGSAFLCADLGMTAEVRDDHTAYIASWLQALKNDKRLIFTAASHAQRACDYLHQLQPQPPRDHAAAALSGARLRRGDSLSAPQFLQFGDDLTHGISRSDLGL